MIRIENGTSWSQPGWYHVRGERDHPISSPATVRMYWNPCAAGAAPLVAALTQELNGAGVPFHAKVVDDPQRYTRADGGVLYLPRSSWSRAAAPLARAYERVAPYLKSPTPLLTKRLAPGLAVADDPGGDESFGMQRMRLVAEGLWNACAVRRESPEDALRAVDERFIAAGLDPARPHLRAKAAADYELAVRPRPRVPFAEA